MIQKQFCTGSEKIDKYFSDIVEAINVLTGEVKSGIPDNSWTIAEIKAWLTQETIDYNGITLKADLLDLVEI